MTSRQRRRRRPAGKRTKLPPERKAPVASASVESAAAAVLTAISDGDGGANRTVMDGWTDQAENVWKKAAT